MSIGAIRAAGGVLWRSPGGSPGEEQIEVAIIHRPRYDDWSLPKGKLAPGESEVDGAIREVLEETGFHVRLGRSLGETRYIKEQDGWTRPKVVRWWAMEAAAGAFVATREVDHLRWLTLADAQDLLTRDHDREVLERFVRGPAPTRSVLLVRHASAGSRASWDRDDHLRPLDDRGWQQAEGLVRLLAHFDPTAILSADYVRCEQTVEPLSESLGLAVQVEPIVSESGYPGNEEAAVRLLRTVGGLHSASVVCSQGDVIPDLLSRLAEEDGVDLPELIVPRKAGTWALTFQGERLVAAELFAPPDVVAQAPEPVRAG
ncbi:MAG: NUDIX hydrolase [Chloroflexota bacterium]|nr:NUDIX hydrolase [Chloroflexota bacterium]